MSGEAVGWVYRHSPFEGATLAVHLALADSANDLHEYELWSANETLATKARVSVSTVKVALAKLIEARFLDVLERSRGGRGNTSRYRFLMPSDAPVVFEQSWRARVEQETGRSPAGSETGRSTPPKPADEEPKPADPREKPAGDRPQTQVEPNQTQKQPNGELSLAPEPDDVSARRPRARNAGWDGLAAAFGAPETDSQRRHFGKIAGQINRIDPAPSAEEVERRARIARELWPTCSIEAVVKHWTMLGEARVRSRPPSRRAEDQDTAGWRDGEPERIEVV